MTYIIKFMDGSRSQMTDEEYSRLGGRAGLINIPSTGEIINMSSVTRIYPEESESSLVDRSRQTHGILHDGTPVVKQFGEWRVENGMQDESGMYMTRPDPTYYPEITRNCVPTAEEYEKKFKHLPVNEWAGNFTLIDPERPQYFLEERQGLVI